MAVVTYRHPDTKDIKQVDPSNDVQIAAVEKLGYVKITGKDITNDPVLTVTHEQVTNATPAVEPPALPKLTKPIPPGPTRDTSPTAPPDAFSTKGETLDESKSKKK